MLRRDSLPRLLTSVPTAVVLAGLIAACGGGPEGPSGRAEREPPSVEAVPARSGSLPMEERFGAVVRALDQVEIRPQIESTVVRVAVRNGDAVQRGDVLVSLRDDALVEQVRQAEASLRVVEATAEEARARAAEVESRIVRTRELADAELVSEMELEAREAELEVSRAQARAAEARVEQVRSQVEERRADLEEAVVRAPVDGLVGRREVEVGQLVDSGTTLFVLGGLDRMVVEVPLTDDVIERVAPGTPVRLETRAGGEPIEAEISRISPFLRRESFSSVAEIDVDNGAGRLRPGMFVTATVLLGRSERATLLPTSVLWEDPGTGEHAVFVVRESGGLAEPDGEAAPADVPREPRGTELRPVHVLARGAGTVGLEGVAEGEWVVTVGQHLLRQELTERRSDATADPVVRARVRPASWQKVLGLQGLQREDLLEGFLDKQQRIARALGAEIPESESEVDAVLAGSSGPTAGTAGPQGS